MDEKKKPQIKYPRGTNQRLERAKGSDTMIKADKTQQYTQSQNPREGIVTKKV